MFLLPSALSTASPSQRAFGFRRAGEIAEEAALFAGEPAEETAADGADRCTAAGLYRGARHAADHRARFRVVPIEVHTLPCVLPDLFGSALAHPEEPKKPSFRTSTPPPLLLVMVMRTLIAFSF